MPSHLSPDDILPRGATMLDVKGNALADKYAARAASKVQVHWRVSMHCIYFYSLTKQIQWRIITIIKNLPERQKYKTARTPKELATSLDTKILESKHDIQRVADRLHCRQCMENFKVGDSSLGFHLHAFICLVRIGPSPL